MNTPAATIEMADLKPLPAVEDSKSTADLFELPMERKDSVTEKCLSETHTDVCSPVAEPCPPALEIKRRGIELPVKELIGNNWLAVILWAAVKDWNRSCMSAAESRKVKIVANVWTLLFLTGSLAFHTYFLLMTSGEASSTAHIIASCIAGLGLVYILFAALELYTLTTHALSCEPLWVAYCWVQCLYCGLCLYNFVVFLMDGNYGAWLYLGLIYCANLPYSTNVILWSMLAPLLLMFFCGEFLMRLLICKLGCPRRESMRRVHTYGLYAFNEALAASEAQCAICLRPFTSESKDLCILMCHTKHIFHEGCIFEWIKRCAYCPICRGELRFRAT